MKVVLAVVRFGSMQPWSELNAWDVDIEKWVKEGEIIRTAA